MYVTSCNIFVWNHYDEIVMHGFIPYLSHAFYQYLDAYCSHVSFILKLWLCLCACLMNGKISWMFQEYNGESLTSKNCMKSLMSMMFNTPNDKMFAFKVYNLRCCLFHITINIPFMIRCWIKKQRFPHIDYFLLNPMLNLEKFDTNHQHSFLLIQFKIVTRTHQKNRSVSNNKKRVNILNSICYLF
jgi:hypothetical protein